MQRHRRGHILKELFETEKIYVNEIASILKVRNTIYWLKTHYK